MEQNVGQLTSNIVDVQNITSTHSFRKPVLASQNLPHTVHSYIEAKSEFQAYNYFETKIKEYLKVLNLKFQSYKNLKVTEGCQILQTESMSDQNNVIGYRP